jgi:hypothetical protein
MSRTVLCNDITGTGIFTGAGVGARSVLQITSTGTYAATLSATLVPDGTMTVVVTSNTNDFYSFVSLTGHIIGGTRMIKDPISTYVTNTTINPIPVSLQSGPNLTVNVGTVLIEGTYNTTPPALTNGQQAPLQLDNDGSLYVNLRDSSTVTVSQVGSTSTANPSPNSVAYTTSSTIITNNASRKATVELVCVESI